MSVYRPQDSSAVDRWLQISLTERYASTLREPVPDALLKLLSEPT